MERLLERQAVLAELAAIGRRIGRGGGQVVLLHGEAGVGKTAVSARFITEVGPPLQVLRGWCDPLSAPRPLGPLIDALAGLGGAHAAALVAAVDTADTAGLYARLLALLGDGQRWLWVIEDVHWADGATLDLLRFLARRIAALPLLLVVSYRDDELGAQHPLTVALGDIASCAALTRIGLEPLSREAVAVLAAGSGINPDQLHGSTDGNPFYVTEVLAAGPDAVSRDPVAAQRGRGGVGPTRPALGIRARHRARGRGVRAPHHPRAAARRVPGRRGRAGRMPGRRGAAGRRAGAAVSTLAGPARHPGSDPRA